LKVLLVRPKNHTSMNVLSFVNVEPLELEYLSAICMEEAWNFQIYDGSIESKKFKNKYKQFDFDAVVMSGYVNSIDTMKEYARYIKEKNYNVKVIVGGVVAEVIPEFLYSENIDFVIHSGGFEPFRKLLKRNFGFNFYQNMKGICFRQGENWFKNDLEEFDIKKLPIPSREHFYANSKKFRYLNYKSTALIKTSYSCPYKCNFCYCKKLNGGKYVFMDMEQIIREISAVECENIWIVDDVFLLDRARVLEFADRIKREGIKKNFIVYSRADFIVNNKDVLVVLKKTGIQMIIVGLEAVNNRNLESYNKCIDEDINRSCVKYLNENEIECMGLFIAGIDYTKKDFINLRLWIKETELESYTISIFTPLPGTENYDKYKDKILFKNYSEYDFLHLFSDPLYLSRKRFYFELYKVYIPYAYTIVKKLCKIFTSKLGCFKC